MITGAAIAVIVRCKETLAISINLEIRNVYRVIIKTINSCDNDLNHDHFSCIVLTILCAKRV